MSPVNLPHFRLRALPGTASRPRECPAPTGISPYRHIPYPEASPSKSVAGGDQW
jgi:hypothetical protein